MENTKALIVKEVERVKYCLAGERVNLISFEEDVSGIRERIKAYEDVLAEYKIVWELIEKEEELTTVNDLFEGKT